MRFRFLILLWSGLLSCQLETKNVSPEHEQKPMVQIQDPVASVVYLCDLLQKISDTSLSDSQYNQLQIRIEALYLGLEFGVNAGFYSDEKLLQIADSLGCLL
jgi:hypothetical protein